MRSWRTAVGLWVVAGCGSDAEEPLSIEDACAMGQMATTGCGEVVADLQTYWSEQSGAGLLAVVAHRVAAPVSAEPEISPPVLSGDVRLAYCTELAMHEVVDGLGHVDDDLVEITAGSGRTYWSAADGTPLPGDYGVHSEFCFEPNHRGLATDDRDYLLFLAVSGDRTWLTWRAPVVGETVSGTGTTSGADAPLDAFRR